MRICVRFATIFNVEKVAVLTYDLVICKESKDSQDGLLLTTIDCDSDGFHKFFYIITTNLTHHSVTTNHNG